MHKIEQIKQNFFIGIGAQRAGTTWLSKYLSDHPEVCFSKIKELHYFDVKCTALFSSHQEKLYRKLSKTGFNIKQQAQTEEELAEQELLKLRIKMFEDEDYYFRCFEKIYQGEKLCGEITPSYATLKLQGFQEIKRMIPNVKIIFILRNPIDRYWSYIRMKYDRKAIADPFVAFDDLLNISRNKRRALYHKTLFHLNKVFDKNQFKVLFYEELFNKETRDTKLKSITDFLQISYINGSFEHEINGAPKIKLPEDLRKKGINNYAKTYKIIKEIYGTLPEKWEQDMKFITQ